MIKFPRNHQADETLARIAVAARRARKHREPLELEPEDDELVDLPADMMPARPMQTSRGESDGEVTSASSAAPTAELAPPPLDESGLDPGTMLAGGDSFDALLKTT